MAIDGSKAKLEVEKEPKLKTDLKESPGKLPLERRVGAARVVCNLPTIEEDQVDDETIDVLSRLERQVSKVNDIVSRPKVKRQQSKARLDYNSDCQKVEKQLSNGNSEPVCQSEQHSRQGPRYKPPVNPKSADLYLHNKKAKMVPHYKQAVGLHSNASDNEDASTRVSSKSQAQRNHVYQKQNVNLEYYQPRDAQTPSQIIHS